MNDKRVTHFYGDGCPEHPLEDEPLTDLINELRHAIETCCVHHERDLKRLERFEKLTRLGAAVEAMPHNTGIHHGAADITSDWFALVATELEDDMHFFKTPGEVLAYLNEA